MNKRGSHRMRIIFYSVFLFIALGLSVPVFADEICHKTVNVGDVTADDWNSSCKSSRRFDTNDPYNPQPYLTKYYTFTIDREADISIDVSGGYNVHLYVLDGETTAGTLLKQESDNLLKSYLPVGTYTVEVTHRYTQSFTITIAYNDTGNTECVQPISAGSTISDGWIPACESNNRDIIDPYSPYPELGYRAKYFTFTLPKDSDISIQVSSDENSYIYLLSGHGEFATPLLEFNDNNVLTPLPAGDYTIELTTYKRYAPGQFTISLSVLENSSQCTKELIFEQITNDNWSNNCLIQTWDNTNNDPYAGINPERATYYTFTLSESSDVRFSKYSSDPEVVLNLYRGSDFSDLLKTNLKDGYWYSSTNSIVEATLAPDTYTLEVTSYNQLAIGSYAFRASVLGVSVCSQSILLSESYTGLLSEGCISQYRKGVNNDPYAPQPGEYYAKRFEFELTEPQALEVTGSLSGSDIFLYLSKKNVSGGMTLLEETEFNYWNGNRTERITRVLDAGTYVVELTSAQPYQTSSYSILVKPVSSFSCEIFLKMNEIMTNSSLRSSCPSHFKESYRNPDPYGSPSEFVFNSKAISFKVETAGDITFDISASGIIPHLYLTSGTDREGSLLIDERMNSGSGVITNYLEAGFYTLEITSSESSPYGSFSIQIKDSNAPLIPSNPSPTEPAPTPNDPTEEPASCESNLLTVSEQVIDGAWSDSCTRSFSVYYYFDLPRIEKIEFTLTADIEAVILIQRKVEGEWDHIVGSPNRFSNTTKLYHLLDEGEYRVEIKKSNLNENGGTFQLTVKGNLGADADNDGVGDDIDKFPQDSQLIGDFDKDGIDDAMDNDLDNDGVINAKDRFPYDPNESLDDDHDGIGNNVDDSPFPYQGIVQLESAEYSVDENAGQVRLFLKRSDFSLSEEMFDYSPIFVAVRTNDGSAKSNRDYKPYLELVEFEASEGYKGVVIDIVDNETFGGEKSFEVELVVSGLMKIGEINRAIVQINDNEPLPPSGVIKWEKSEERVDENTSEVSFALIREGDMQGDVVVNYATHDGSAVAGIDYHATSGSVTFSEGESTKSVTVSFIDNETPGFNKNFLLEITHANNGAFISENSKKITIVDNDEDLTFSLVKFKEPKLEIDEYHGNIGIEVIREGNLEILSTVEWGIKSDNAEEGTDFVDDGGILQFSAGESSKFILVKLLGDFEPDGIKKVTVELFNPSTKTAIVENSYDIVLNDFELLNLGGFYFSSEEHQVQEGSGTYGVAVLRSFVRYRNMRVDYTVKAVTATNGEDFTVSDGTLEFAGSFGDALLGVGDISHSIPIDINDDEQYEGIEYFEIQLKNPQEEDFTGEYQDAPELLRKNNIARIYIIDNEDPPVSGEIRFSNHQYKVSETENSTVITVQRINGSAGEVSVDYSTIEGSALANEHFNTAAGMLNFLDGEVVKTIPVELINNDKDEVSRLFKVALSNPIGADIHGKMEVSVLIKDDDVTLFGLVSLENTTYEINRSEGSLRITLNRTEGTEGEISVDYQIITLDGKVAQFSDATGSVTFKDGEDSKILEFSLDEKAEVGDGDYQIVLSGKDGSQFKGASTVSVKVLDDEISTASDESESKNKKGTLFGSLSLWFMVVTAVFLLLLMPRRRVGA